MKPLMVVAKFRAGTSMEEVLSVVGAEQERVAVLQREGRVMSVFLATAARQKVFLEVIGLDHSDAESIVRTLPMAKWWDVDVYPLNAPAQPEMAS